MNRHPSRPTLPPLTWGAVGVFVGVLGAEEVSWRALVGSGVSLGAIALVAVACTLFLATWVYARGTRGFGRVPILALVLIGICLGMTSGSLSWARWHAAHVHASAGLLPVQGVVVRDPQLGRWGWSLSLRPERTPGVSVRIQLPPGTSPPLAAQRVRVGERIVPLDPADEWARRSHMRGEIGSVRARSVEVLGWSATPQGFAAPVRARVRSMLEDVSGVGGDLLRGILIGDRSSMRGTAAEQDLRICGLSHLLAVSGTHLGILGLLMGWLAVRTGRSVRTKVLAVSGTALLYVLMTGVQTSSVRALAMGALAGVAALSGRRADGLAALSAAAGSMLVSNPFVAFDAGFRLSVCAVGGLLVFAGLAGAWVEAALGQKARRIAGPVAVTLVAQLATLPVALPLFGMLSLVSPLANLVAIPLVTVSLAGGLAAGALGLAWAPVGRALLSAAALPLELLAALTTKLAELPGAAIGLDVAGTALGTGALIVGALIWAWWPVAHSRKHARAVGAVVAVVLVVGMLGTPYVGPPALIVLDVGQGDAILVRDGRSAVLVDTGPDPDTLRSALTAVGVRRLDAVVLTHDHADHTGGMAGLIGLVRAERVFGPAVSDEEAFSSVREHVSRVVAGESGSGSVESLRAGDAFVVGRTRLAVLWPPGPDPGLSANDTSVVLEVSRGGFTALLTGDAEEPVWKAMARADTLRRVDVLKVPHHGSTNGLTAEALEVWQPRLALISVGQPNDFAHPAPAVLELLEASGARIARTDQHGRITVRMGTGDFVLEGPADGGLDAACATIGAAALVHRKPAPSPIYSGDHGRHRPLGPQTGLPHLRHGRPPARTGGRPAETAPLGGGGPRLQSRCVRRGDRGGRGDRRSGQHPAVHVRAPPRDRPQG